MDLDSLKYSDLQQLAKEAGIKANTKADKLLRALKQYYQHPQRCEKNSAESPRMRRKRSGEERSEPDDHSSVVERESIVTEQISTTKRVRVEAEHGQGIPTLQIVSDVDEQVVKAGGKIPRHEKLLKREKRPGLKATTPNFKKLHEAHFNKMESIDSYVQRKNLQMEAFRNSVKELKMLTEKTVLKRGHTSTVLNPNGSCLLSPVAQNKRSGCETSARSPAVKDEGVFKPTNLSPRKISVRFAQKVPEKQSQCVVVKTPARISAQVSLSSTPAGDQTKPDAKAAVNTPGAFVFKGNPRVPTTPGLQRKTAFDLKASLSRPLTYQPHKGKLKPFGSAQENAPLNQSHASCQNYKQHRVQTREERRVKHVEERKRRKEKMLGARRGLTEA